MFRLVVADFACKEHKTALCQGNELEVFATDNTRIYLRNLGKTHQRCTQLCADYVSAKHSRSQRKCRGVFCEPPI